MRIELKDLKKTYHTKDGTIAAVNGISLSIPDNTIFGIIGKSGAGKSTLVRLISMLEQPDGGAVYYDGKRVDNLQKAALIAQRRRIGMIFQNFNLFSSRTAARNIAYPLEICRTPRERIRERVAEMLHLVGLADRGGAAVSTLSGGQKQRVAIARALATRPDILFCDEATSALDPQTTRSILDLIRTIQQSMNLTVVMITHQMEVVRDACQQVAVIDDGTVAEQGMVEDIFARPRSAVTRDFLARITESIPQGGGGAAPQLLRWSRPGGKYTLRFVGESTDRPLISQASRKFGVDMNIRAGGIQHLPDKDVGTMIADIAGTDGEVQNAIAFLQENGIIVEETV